VGLITGFFFRRERRRLPPLYYRFWFAIEIIRTDTMTWLCLLKSFLVCSIRFQSAYFLKFSACSNTCSNTSSSHSGG
jgi:hypothetical protein